MQKCSGATLISIMLILGCAVAPDHQYQLAPGRGYAGGPSSVLLIPINETGDTTDGLEKGSDIVQAEIVSLLEAKGVQVEAADREAYRQTAAAAYTKAQRQALRGTGTSASRAVDYGQLVPAIVEELAPEADLIVVPNMVMRVGEYTGNRSLEWDGVRRRTPGTATMLLTGNSLAASLRVVIYEPDGTEIFDAYGGVDLLYQIDRGKQRFELIPDRLEDIDNIREGVCIAFHPFFSDTNC